MRAFLTMLGIIIGVTSVITMIAIGQGSKQSIQAQISEMGSNMIMIHPGGEMRGGVRQSADDMQTLDLADYESLRQETTFLSAVSPNVSSSGQLIAGNNNYPSSISGVGTGLPANTPTDGGERRNVYRTGHTDLRQGVYHRQDHRGQPFPPTGRTPSGRLSASTRCPSAWWACSQSKGYNSMGMDQDDIVLAPYSTVMKRLLAQTYLQGIFASALSEGMTDYATEGNRRNPAPQPQAEGYG